MSEAKRTPLPLVMRRGTWFLALRDSEGNPYVFVQDGDRPTFDHERIAEEIRTSVNARPKVEELVESAKDAQAVIASFAHGRGLDSREASTQKRLEESIREVEAALGGKAHGRVPPPLP